MTTIRDATGQLQVTKGPWATAPPLPPKAGGWRLNWNAFLFLDILVLNVRRKLIQDFIIIKTRMFVSWHKTDIMQTIKCV